MNFTSSFLALLAVAQTVVAFPFASSGTAGTLAPVPVNSLVCDGDTYKCTAYLQYGDGNWVAQWDTAVFHTGLFGHPDHKQLMQQLAMAPVPVTKLVCDGDSYKCTADLDFGDGRWRAQWSTNVFHRSFAGSDVSAMAPVPAQNLVCDGDTYKCTADLDFGDGRWVAQWGANVFHTSNAKLGFLKQGF